MRTFIGIAAGGFAAAAIWLSCSLRDGNIFRLEARSACNNFLLGDT
jgi:hypothetical protein